MFLFSISIHYRFFIVSKNLIAIILHYEVNWEIYNTLYTNNVYFT